MVLEHEARATMTVDLSVIHEKMRPVVALLNANGFTTTDSGDGVTNVELGMEGALPFPHVFGKLSAADIPQLAGIAKRMARLLQENDVGLGDGDVQFSYNAKDGVLAFIVTWGAK